MMLRRTGRPPGYGFRIAGATVIGRSAAGLRSRSYEGGRVRQGRLSTGSEVSAAQGTVSFKTSRAVLDNQKAEFRAYAGVLDWILTPHMARA